MTDQSAVTLSFIQCLTWREASLATGTYQLNAASHKQACERFKLMWPDLVPERCYWHVGKGMKGSKLLNKYYFIIGGQNEP